MNKLPILGVAGVLGLAGCANFCDHFFRARNVCADQTATAVPATIAAPPTIVGEPIAVPSAPMVMNESAVVMSPQVIVGDGCACACSGFVDCAAVPVVVAQPEKKGHPLLRPFRAIFTHNRSN